MTKHKRSGRGVAATDMGNFQYGFGPVSPSYARRPLSRQRSVDPSTLKRAYMLQNFQFVLRHDVGEPGAGQGVPCASQHLGEALTIGSTLLPWDIVSAVVVRGAPDEFQCPICLGAPLAARITDCGHIFCLVCMVQYLSRRKAERLQCTCPVCQNTLSLSTLRPCILRPTGQPSVGESVCFTLLKRYGDCCILLRQDDPRWNESRARRRELSLPVYGEPSESYSRYILGTEEREAAQRENDCMAIVQQMSEVERRDRPLTQFDDDLSKCMGEALQLVLRESSPLQRPVHGKWALSPTEKHADPEAVTVYELYGESEGQPYYLHYVTYKMLRMDAAARCSSFPISVKAPLLDVVTFTQDEASRRHYKVFSHVPVHGTVKLCLLDLRDVVLPSTMQAFAPTLERMLKTRRERCGKEGAVSDDTTWQEYLRRYRTNWSWSADGVCVEVSPISEFAQSDLSGGSGRVPMADLPELHLPDPLTVDNDSGKQPPSSRHGCWSAGDSRLLFAVPPVQAVAPTWGGHAFNPRKPSGPGTVVTRQGQ
ncbi:Zinc finger C3HC4 type (RING finger) [Trypanosoma vivax]|nr:Zinc finger C3HC4 type (RING finger) [Trypanosoma vivax]